MTNETTPRTRDRRLGFGVLAVLLLTYATLFSFTPTALAAPTVVTSASGNSGANTGASVITMPTGVTSGDLLIVMFNKDGDAAPTSITGTGWNSLGGSAAGTGNYTIAYWKIANGSDTLTVNHASEGTAFVSYRITGHDSSATPAIGTYAIGTNANPNPPSLTPSWGSQDTLWIAFYGWDGNNAHTLYPTNYASNQQTSRWAHSNGSGIAAATDEVTAATEDPGTGTIGANDDWAAQTIAVKPPNSAITFSGTLYSDEGVTQLTSKTIKAAIGTSTVSLHSTTTNSGSGAWSLTIPAGHSITPSTPITIWVDEATENATLFTKASSTENNIAVLDLYQNRVIIRHEGTSGTSTQNTNMAFYDGDDDSDIQYTSNGGALSVRAGNKLFIWANDVYAPGGPVTVNGNAGTGVDGSFHIGTGATYTAGGTTTIAGNFSASSTASFTGHASGTIFNATTTGKTIDTSLTSWSPTFNGVGGGWTFPSDASTTNLTVTAGTVAITGNLNLYGNLVNSGTLTVSGTTTMYTDATTVTGTAAPSLGNVVLQGGMSGRAGWATTTNPSSSSDSAYATWGDTDTLYVTGTRECTAGQPCGADTAGSALYTIAYNKTDGSFRWATTTNPSSNFDNAYATWGDTDTLYVAGYRVCTASQPCGADSSSSAFYTIAYNKTDGSLRWATTTNPSSSSDQARATWGDTDTLYVAGNRYCTATTPCGADTSNTSALYTIAYNKTDGSFRWATTTNPSNSSDAAMATWGDTDTLYVAGYRDCTASQPCGADTSNTSAYYTIAYNKTDGSFRWATTTNPSSTYDAAKASWGDTDTLYMTGQRYCTASTPCGADTLGTAYYTIAYNKTDGSLRWATTTKISSNSDVANATWGDTDTLYVTGTRECTAGQPCGADTAGSALYTIAYNKTDGSFRWATTTNPSSVLDEANATWGDTDTLYVAGYRSCTVGQPCGADSSSSAFYIIAYSKTDGSGTIATTTNAYIFTGNASTTNLTIGHTATSTNTALTAPTALTIAGNYTNYGTFTAGSGTTTFSSASAQTATGTMTGASALGKLAFTGAGTKTFGANASTSAVTINSGATVVAPASLSVSAGLTNAGTLTATATALTVGTTFSNTGTFTAATTTLSVGSTFSNTGTYTNTSGQLSLYGDLTNSGTFTNTGTTTMYTDGTTVTGTAAPSLGNVVLTGGTFGRTGWATTTDPTSGTDRAYGITSDATTVYVTGTRADGGVLGGWAYYTVAYAKDTGATLWATTTDPTSSGDYAYGITSDATTVYVTGFRWNGGALGGFAYYTVAYAKDTGATLWATTTDPTSGNDIANAITSDATTVYVTGTRADGGALGGIAYYTVAYAKDTGATLWATTTDPTSGTDIAQGITSDTTAVYVTGYRASGGALGGEAYYTVSYNKLDGSGSMATTTNSYTFTGSASTTNLTIGHTASSTNTEMVAPTALTVAGNYTNNGTFTAGTGTTTFSGTTAQTATGTLSGTSAFYNLRVTNNTATTTFGAPVTVTNQFSLNTPSTTVALVAGATSTIATLTITGTSGNEVKLRSTTPGTKAGLMVTGTSSVSYANIKDSSASSTSGLITVTDGIDGGNTNGWSFGGVAPGDTITISGVLYESDRVTPVAASQALVLAVATSTVSLHTTNTTVTTGAFTFTIDVGEIATATPLTVYVDGNATLKAVTVTKAQATTTSSAITNLPLYKNHLIVKHEATSGTSTTIADLSYYDNDNDSDIPFTATTTAGTSLIVSSPMALLIASSSTFAPGGAVTVRGNASTTHTDGSLHLAPSSTYTAGGNTTLAGSFTASTSAVFTPGSYTTTLNATTTGKTLNYATTTGSLGALALTGVGGGWSIVQNATTTGFTVATGTLTAPSGTLTARTMANGGTFTNNNGTLIFNGTSSALVGGDAVNSSWADATYEYVFSLTSHNGTLYAGLGLTAGDAEVWAYNGSTWTLVGGDAVNSSWADATYEYVYSLTSHNGTLYAGVGGNSAGEAEVWAYNGSMWTKVGGDAVNSSWADATYETVYSLTSHNGTLYAGLGASSGDAEVWAYNGSTWSKIGGDAVNSSWANTTYDRVHSLISHNSTLYAGLGITAGEAEVWAYNGSMWTKVGGDAVNSSWADATYETVYSLTSHNGTLYAGLSANTGDAEVWRIGDALIGTLTGSSALNNVSVTGSAYIASAASTTDLTITSTGSLLAPTTTLSIAGSYTQNGTFLDNFGTVNFSGASAQTIAGTMTGTSTDFRRITFTGAGTKTFSNNASTTNFTIATSSGAVSFPNNLTVAGNFVNNSTLTAGSGTTTFVGGTALASLVGGDATNSSWADATYDSIHSLTSHNGTLYAGLGFDPGDAEVWSYNGSTWTKVGGDAVNSSWADATYEIVYSLTSHNGTLYAGLGSSAGDAEVWSYNGSTWTKVGGDAVNSSWADATYEAVYSLTSHSGLLYAGLGNGTGDAEVWAYNGSTWSKVGGDALNSSWADSTYEHIYSLVSHNGTLYAGVSGNTAGEAEVWAYNGSTWTKVGGDAVNSSWADATYELVPSLTSHNGTLYAGLGNGTGDAEVWAYNGSTWSKVGGDALNSSWADAAYERVQSLTSHNGTLYAGLGQTAGDAEVWAYNGNTWTKVGGDTVNSSWSDATYEYVFSLTSHNGTLYAGLGINAGDAEVWAFPTPALSGNLTGSSALNNFNLADGARIFNNNASTTNFTIGAYASVTAPSALSITGDYTNNGTFTHNSGTTTFLGSAAQTATGTMTGTSAFNTLVTTGAGVKTFSTAASTTNFTIGTTATTSFSGAVSGTNLTVVTPAAKVAFAAGATSTFDTVTITGSSTATTTLRSSTPGTQAALYLTGAYDISYVDVKDSHGSSSLTGPIDATYSTSTGNVTGWNFVTLTAGAATIASGAHQTFALSYPTTAISPITITDATSPSITAASDLRITIATSSVTMLWDTTDTTATFSGTAAEKVSTTVSYEGNGSILVIDVTENFAASDTLTISGLSFTNFTAINVATTALAVDTDGAALATSTAWDDKDVTITGSLTVDNHTEDQVDSSFRFPSDNSAELYRYTLTPNGENMTITTTTFTLTGINGVNQADLSSLVLYKDNNNNGLLDGGDTAVGGTGVLTITGQTGTITFSTAYTLTTTTDFLLIGAITEIRPGDMLTIALPKAGIITTGDVSLGTVPPVGSISSIQHIRGGMGRSSGSYSLAPIGGDAPEGTLETGGGQGGGSEIDTNTGGATLTDLPDFRAPSAQSGSWANGANGINSDGSYATINSAASEPLTHTFTNFDFNIPGTNQITGIEVKLEASATTNAGTISAELSPNNASSYTSAKTTATLTTSDTIYTLGGQSDAWGHSWTPAAATEANFVLRVTGAPSSNTVQIDAIRVRVYHQSTGGGQGGGVEVRRPGLSPFAGTGVTEYLSKVSTSDVKNWNTLSTGVTPIPTETALRAELVGALRELQAVVMSLQASVGGR